jgi:hypothetical protein
VPEGFFLLVRKGREIGAIRFTSIRQNAPPIGKSTYEAYFQGDGSGRFAGTGVVRRSGEIDIRPMRGISHSLTWQPGPDKLRVGNWWFGSRIQRLRIRFWVMTNLAELPEAGNRIDSR